MVAAQRNAPEAYKCRYCGGEQGLCNVIPGTSDCSTTALDALRTSFSELTKMKLPEQLQDVIIKYCLSNSKTREKAADWLKTSLGITKEVLESTYLPKKLENKTTSP